MYKKTYPGALLFSALYAEIIVLEMLYFQSIFYKSTGMPLCIITSAAVFAFLFGSGFMNQMQRWVTLASYSSCFKKYFDSSGLLIDVNFIHIHHRS